MVSQHRSVAIIGLMLALLLSSVGSLRKGHRRWAIGVRFVVLQQTANWS